MADDYAPFPEVEMTSLALWHENHAAPFVSPQAQLIRSAIASYRALNERCLRAELERDHGVAP